MKRRLIALALILGLIAGVFISLERERRASLEGTKDRDALIALYEEELQVQEDLLAEQERVYRERQAFREAYLNAGQEEAQVLQDLRDEIQEARLMAGFTTLEGPGLEIRLADASGIDYATASSDQLIHDSHLRFIVDWLKVQDVLGIAINGERLTTSSKIVCNGPTVQVNRVMHGMPYVIQAVCDPEYPASLLVVALESLKPIVDMREAGILVEVHEVPDLTLPAFEDQQMINEAVGIMTPQEKPQEPDTQEGD